ncbi:unnamed protein product [Closterium sp. Naga37s-1]|nr:unnamed protein product [Closterium sp. Naga37s-1]
MSTPSFRVLAPTTPPRASPPSSPSPPFPPRATSMEDDMPTPSFRAFSSPPLLLQPDSFPHPPTPPDMAGEMSSPTQWCPASDNASPLSPEPQPGGAGKRAGDGGKSGGVVENPNVQTLSPPSPTPPPPSPLLPPTPFPPSSAHQCPAGAAECRHREARVARLLAP